MLKADLLSFCLFIFCPVVLAAQGAGRGLCGAPKYKVAVVVSEKPESQEMGISIQPKDVTIKNIFALACQLRADYPKKIVVGADIFNDEKAAKYTHVYGVEFSKNSNETAYLASYTLDRQKGTETLTLAVDQQDPCGHNIKIDLKTNAVSIVSCK